MAGSLRHHPAAPEDRGGSAADGSRDTAGTEQQGDSNIIAAAHSSRGGSRDSSNSGGRFAQILDRRGPRAASDNMPGRSTLKSCAWKVTGSLLVSLQQLIPYLPHTMRSRE
jgi:hypothetical protein